MLTIHSRPIKYQCSLSQPEKLIIDATADKGGTGLGIRPHELLEAALASCMNISLRKNAENMGVMLRNVETFVHVNRTVEGKTIFEYGYNILDDLDETSKEKIADILKDCAVRKTLSKQIEFRKI
jgi:putative redox protein